MLPHRHTLRSGKATLQRRGGGGEIKLKKAHNSGFWKDSGRLLRSGTSGYVLLCALERPFWFSISPSRAAPFHVPSGYPPPPSHANQVAHLSSQFCSWLDHTLSLLPQLSRLTRCFKVTGQLHRAQTQGKCKPLCFKR